MQQRILPKGKGLPWWQPSSDLYSSILANWRELTGSEFSASFGFGLCGLGGFALLRGLDKIFEGLVMRRAWEASVKWTASGAFDFVRRVRQISLRTWGSVIPARCRLTPARFTGTPVEMTRF
jgi:hypothetical protein